MEPDSYSTRTYFKLNKLFMFSTGVWPYQSPYAAWIFKLLWCAQHISIFTAEMIKLYEIRHDTDLVLECIPPVCYNFVIGALYANNIYHKGQMKMVIEKIHKNWTRLSDKSEIEILTRYSDTGRTMDCLYVGVLYSAGLVFALLPLAPIFMDYVNPLSVSRERQAMYRVEFFVDDEKYYWTILMHAYATTVIGLIPLMTVDLFLANSVQHICGILAILGKRLESTLKPRPGVKNLDETIYKDVRDCIILHAEILDFVEDLNNIFGTAFGLLLIVLISLTSLTGVVVLIKWGEWHQVIRFGLFTIGEFFHSFCYSYHSQDLIDHNDQLYISIMNSGWYKSSTRTRLLVQMMLLRSSKPCLINCIIFPLSMEKLTWITKTIFSYFTVVKSCRY